MNLTHNAAIALAAEPGLTGADIRVWLFLVDEKASAAELAVRMNTAPTNTAASCRRLLQAGWVDVVEVVGRSKRYKARQTRNPNANLPGQMDIEAMLGEDLRIHTR